MFQFEKCVGSMFCSLTEFELFMLNSKLYRSTQKLFRLANSIEDFDTLKELWEIKDETDDLRATREFVVASNA